MGRPLIDPESPGGMNAWIGYLAGKVESIDSRQNRQNGSVDRLVAEVAKLPCVANEGRLAKLERAGEKHGDRAYSETRDRKQNLSLFAIKLAMVLATFGLGLLVTRIC